jgi:multidrug efflux pump subunit AcrA (membrane-fusion protein)
MEIEMKRKLIIVLCTLSLLCACSKKQAPVQAVVRPVKSMVIQLPETSAIRTYPAKVQASKKVTLTFKVSGPLMELPIKEGDDVKKGALLARMDPRDYKTALSKIRSAIATARAKFKSMKAARPEDIKVLEAQVSAAKAQLDQANQDYERSAGLYEQNLASKAEYDRFKSMRDIANARLKTARQNLEKGQKGARSEDIEAMNSDINGLKARQNEALNALEDTYLKAPFSGTVARIFVENYQNIRAGEPILSLQDISGLEIIINAPERVVAESSSMDCFVVTAVFDSLPGKTYKLKIKEFAVEADPQTRTYRVVFSMKAPKNSVILPGMTCTVKTVDTCIHANDSIFRIPVNATFADVHGKSFVWIINPDKMTVHKRAVELGDMTGDSIRVLKGLKAGERIVTAGVNYLQEDMKVRLLK